MKKLHSYRMSLAICYLQAATLHKWIQPALTPSKRRYSIYLPQRDGWLDLGDPTDYRYTPRWFTCPQMITHPSTNPAVHGQEWIRNLLITSPTI